MYVRRTYSVIEKNCKLLHRYGTKRSMLWVVSEPNPLRPLRDLQYGLGEMVFGGCRCRILLKNDTEGVEVIGYCNIYSSSTQYKTGSLQYREQYT